MNTIFKKFIVALLLIMILFNFTFSNCTPVYAGIKEDIEGILGGIIGIFTWPNRLMAMALAFCVNVLTAQVAYVDGDMSRRWSCNNNAFRHIF